jgi:hypothetical protein
MNQEFIEHMAPPAKKRRGPSFRQLEFERRYRRSTIESQVKRLEKQFADCDKMEEPGRWLYLQDELGRAYKCLMEMERK